MRRNRKRTSPRFRFPLAAAIVLLTATTVAAQRLAPDITIKFDKMPAGVRPLWNGAEQALQEYLRAPAWHDDLYDYAVPFNATIIIDQVIQKPPEWTYKCFLMVNNGGETQFSDKRWQFPLPEWRHIVRDGRFHPMMAGLEFYAMLVLAAEFDKWELYGGEMWYTRARRLADVGKFDTRYINGWPERQELMDELVAPANKGYRRFLYYAFTGEYISRNDPDAAKAFVDSAFALLPKLPVETRTQFFSASALLLGDAATRLRRADYLQRLVELDTTGAARYRAILDTLHPTAK